MAINLATKASDKVVERFALSSCTEGLFTNKYNWTGVSTVQVYSVDTLPLNDYDRSLTSGSRFGDLSEVGDTMQELTVTDDKSFNGAIDKGNDTSQLMIKSAGSILRRQTDEVIIPYVDKYRLAALAAGAGLTYSDAASSFTREDAIEHIMSAGILMDNELVPRNNRVLFIGATAAKNIKLADEVIGTEKLAVKSIVNGVCGVIDDNQVRIVPDTYMPDGVLFMIVRKGCAVAPKKIETFRIIEEDKDIDGAIVQGRILHDCFVLDTLKNGICVAESA